ncbi:ZIP family metal transporter [Halosegnis marinus]|uniref:ZIP family metal transporter n=1 Tax=Halosegnis marinus TaxID=3034023 RepID=A0ABD5ZLF2_9EURY|nr:ZIP family metal transporter [Halosegnis sp. DT85]
MSVESVTVPRVGDVSLAGVAGTLLLLALTVVGLRAGTDKVLVVSWVAFLAMGGFAYFGARAAGTQDAYRLVWGYGLAAGAMITSAAVFLLPQAFGLGGQVGGFGVAAGILAGYGAHTVGHRLTHLDTSFDDTALQISAHALAAGLIIGVIYAALPTVGLLLGLAIVSHKGPAGYAAARRLRKAGKPVSVLLFPAAAVGLTAIPVAVLDPTFSTGMQAAVFGFGAGVFLHVAMDFLPECETGTEVGEVARLSEDAHALLDRLRVHAVASTLLGGLAVFAAWLVIA